MEVYSYNTIHSLGRCATIFRERNCDLKFVIAKSRNHVKFQGHHRGMYFVFFCPFFLIKNGSVVADEPAPDVRQWAVPHGEILYRWGLQGLLARCSEEGPDPQRDEKILGKTQQGVHRHRESRHYQVRWMSTWIISFVVLRENMRACLVDKRKVIPYSKSPPSMKRPSLLLTVTIDTCALCVIEVVFILRLNGGHAIDSPL